jgi:hypothetical protein
MKTQRLTIALTVVNLSILLIVLLLFTTAFKPEVVSVLRGHAFELVDDQGKVRAEIKILPEDPTFKMPDGTVGSPETVLFRLIDSQGGPNVKIGATDDGAGLVLGGESGYVQILSRTADPTVKLRNEKGIEKIIELK